MRRVTVFLIPFLLGGCAVWSPIVRSDLVSYSDVIEQTSDKFLLRNILEARDDAPIHFVELPKINGTLQMTAGLTSTLPISVSKINGGGSGSAINGTIGPSFSVQSTPSFEVDNLVTKDFVTGVTSPMDPRFVKYWSERGLDTRIMLLLFFSSAQIVRPCDKEENPKCSSEQVITIRNDPRETANALAGCVGSDCHARTQFELYLKLIDTIRGAFVARDYKTRSLVARKVRIKDPKDIANFDPSQYELGPVNLGDENNPDIAYNIYSATSDSKVVLCIGSTPAVTALNAPAKGDATCSQDVVTNPIELASPPASTQVEQISPGGRLLSEACESEDSSDPYCKLLQNFLGSYQRNHAVSGGYRFGLTMRSAAEMVRFLGDLLYYQDHIRADRSHHIPLTLGFKEACSSQARSASDRANCFDKADDVFFQINGSKGTPRFSLSYRGSNYSVAQDDQTDHSLEMLSMVNAAINLNKSAANLLGTPTIRVIP